MKKAFIAFASVLAALVIVLTVFSEGIGALIAKTVYKEKISVYSKSGKIEAAQLKENDYIYFGTYNGESILWKVISVSDDGKPLLLSERAICFMPFNSGIKAAAGSSNWATSTIREWLNSVSEETFTFECSPENKIKNNRITVSGGFLSSANFSEDEISAIDNGGDRIFLPSKAMLSKLSLDQRKKAPTASAVINDGSSYIQFRSSCWYWTQNPINTNTSSVTAVTTSGGYYKSISNDGLTGVCPAAYLKSCKVFVSGGNGSVNTPYIFKAEETK